MYILVYDQFLFLKILKILNMTNCNCNFGHLIIYGVQLKGI